MSQHVIAASEGHSGDCCYIPDGRTMYRRGAQKPSAIMQWGIVARSQEKPRVQSQKCMYGAMRCPNGTMGALAHDLMIPHAAGYAASCRWPWLPAAVHEGPAMGLRVRSCISKDLMIPLAASYRRPWLRCCCLLSQVQLVLKLCLRPVGPMQDIPWLSACLSARYVGSLHQGDVKELM